MTTRQLTPEQMAEAERLIAQLPASEREWLDMQDAAFAAALLDEGYSRDRVLEYARGWANDSKHEAWCDGVASARSER